MASFDHFAVGARGGGFGLDAELARKREAEYDHRAEDEVRVREETSSTAYVWRIMSFVVPKIPLLRLLSV